MSRACGAGAVDPPLPAARVRGDAPRLGLSELDTARSRASCGKDGCSQRRDRPVWYTRCVQLPHAGHLPGRRPGDLAHHRIGDAGDPYPLARALTARSSVRPAPAAGRAGGAAGGLLRRVGLLAHPPHAPRTCRAVVGARRHMSPVTASDTGGAVSLTGPGGRHAAAGLPSRCSRGWRRGRCPCLHGDRSRARRHRRSGGRAAYRHRLGAGRRCSGAHLHRREELLVTGEDP